MATPLPGNTVRGSKTGKPIMALLDLLGRTWALGIIWNLSNDAFGFNELQIRCDGISPTLLTTRLKELQQAMIVEKKVDGYQLTAFGKELFELVYPMGALANQWKLLIAAQEGNEHE